MFSELFMIPIVLVGMLINVFIIILFVCLQNKLVTYNVNIVN